MKTLSKKEKTKIVIRCFVAIIIIAAIVVGMMFIWEPYNFLYSDKGWKKVTIPTNTDYQAAIKIPEEWSFTTDDEGFAQLLDDTNKIIAQEIVHGEKITTTQIATTWLADAIYHSGYEENFFEWDSYEKLHENWSGSCFVYQHKETGQYLINCYLYYAGEENCYMWLLFDKSMDEGYFDILKQMSESYDYGGTY